MTYRGFKTTVSVKAPCFLFFHFPDILQPVQGLVQGIIPLCKMEPDQVIYILPKEAGSRNGANPYLFGKLLAEQIIVLITKFADIHKHVIRPLGIRKRQSYIAQPSCKQFLHMCVVILKLLVR